MLLVSTKHVERNIRIEPSFAEKWARATNPITRAADARLEMDRQGIAIFRRRGMPQWALDIVKICAGRRNVSLPTIAGDHRFRDAVRARNEALYLIYLRKSHSPSLSCPLIGRWFDRDHTSVLHGIASHQEAHGLTRIVGYNIKAARLRSTECKRAQKRLSVCN